MKIPGGNGSLNTALMGLTGQNDAKKAAQQALRAKTAQNSAALAQASRDLADQIQGVQNSYDMASENVDLSLIWQRARDQGLGEQTGMALEARDSAVRAANEATLTDAQRQPMNAEIKAMSAETTRIGLTNNINGSHTLARFGEVEEVLEIEKEVEVTGQTVTETKPQIDVLWVVDRSGSMGDKIAHIKQDASKMYQALEDKGFTTRMAIESFEMGLDNNGSPDFRSDAATFEQDVARVLGNIWGGIENGLQSLDQAMSRFGEKFSPDATKVTILLSDEYSDDFSAQSGWWKTGELDQGNGSEQLRQQVADSLKEVGSELFVVGVNPYSPSDKDYTDVIDKVGKGASFLLDWQGKWVDDVTKNFIASVERDVAQTKTTQIVKERVVTTKTTLLDEWDLTFQVGPGAGEHLTERFKTSTAETSGLAGAEAGTAEKAWQALDTIDGALKFLGENQTQVGTLQTRFGAIRNDLDQRALAAQKDLPALRDAFDPKADNSLFGLLSMHLKLK